MVGEIAQLLPYIFPIVGFFFSAVFITAVIIILYTALKKTDVTQLFRSAGDDGISITKFWQNVAYAASTVAFLSLNISGNVSGGSLEILWVIYLGVIGSNAVLSKWITMKYTRETKDSKDDRYGGYHRDPYPRSKSSPRDHRGDEFDEHRSRVADPDD